MTQCLFEDGWLAFIPFVLECYVNYCLSKVGGYCLLELDDFQLKHMKNDKNNVLKIANNVKNSCGIQKDYKIL